MLISLELVYGQRLLVLGACVTRFGGVRVDVLDEIPELPTPPTPGPNACTASCTRRWAPRWECRCKAKYHARWRWTRVRMRRSAASYLTRYVVDRWTGRTVLDRKVVAA
jgi:hypothetical protein